MKKSINKFILILLALLFLFFNTNVISRVYAETEKTHDYIQIFKEVFVLISRFHVDSVNTKELIYGAARGMVSTLDAFSQFMEPEEYMKIKERVEGEFGGLGIRISIKDKYLVVVTPLIGTPAYKAGILPGDKIVKINDEDARDITLNEAVEQLRGDIDTKVKLTVLREQEESEIDFVIKRDKIKIASIVSEEISPDIGYVRITEFSLRTAEDLDKALKNLEQKEIKALILDLRNNPGGVLDSAIDVCKVFIGQEKLLVYTQSGEGKKIEYKADKMAAHKYLPLVVLVNRGSASGAEIVAGAIRDWKRGIVLGSQTFGKGSVQEVIRLSDGAALRLTTAKYYTPIGECIHNVGIKPDIEVNISRELTLALMQKYDDIKFEEEKIEKQELKDPQLEYALSILKAREMFFDIET